MSAVIQVASRFWALWGIVGVAPKECSTGAVRLLRVGSVSLELNLITLLICWSVTEVLRYGFYACKVTISCVLLYLHIEPVGTRGAEVWAHVQELGTMPYPLLWLRYSTFVPLYPLGVASEMTMVYLAMPHIKAARPLSVSMPNSLNFGFDYYIVCWLAIACYIPGLPELYLHMLRQRKKILGSGAGKATKVQ